MSKGGQVVDSANFDCTFQLLLGATSVMSYQRFCLRFHSLATEASNVSFRGCWVVTPLVGVRWRGAGPLPEVVHSDGVVWRGVVWRLGSVAPWPGLGLPATLHPVLPPCCRARAKPHLRPGAAPNPCIASVRPLSANPRPNTRRTPRRGASTLRQAAAAQPRLPAGSDRPQRPDCQVFGFGNGRPLGNARAGLQVARWCRTDFC